jgi:VIT1/CCC1 family predicted Fe2+/Mn2+ transporter
MRLSTSVVIAALTLVAGLLFREHHLWIPTTVLLAGIFDLFTRGWYSSDAVGEWIAVSTVLKFLCGLVGAYATIGQLLCIGLIGWWVLG